MRLLSCVALAAAACGGGGAGSWDGHDAPEEMLGFTAVWVFAPDDVWLSGGQGVYHFDGAVWTPSTTPLVFGGVEDFWGIAPDDLWGAAGGTVIHWDGTAWSEVPLGGSEPSGSVLAVWASSSTDVWVGGGINGEAIHWDGGMWTLHITQAWEITDLWGSGPSDVWAAGREGFFHWQGSTWTEVPGPPEHDYDPPVGLWGFGPSDVFAAGDWNSLSHWNGESWTGRSTEEDDDVDDYVSVWGAAPDDVWAVGDGGAVAHFDGSGWSFDHTGLYHRHEAIHGSSAADVWIAGWHIRDVKGILLHGP